MLETPEENFMTSSTNVRLDSGMNWLNCGGQRVKVKNRRVEKDEIFERSTLL